LKKIIRQVKIRLGGLVGAGAGAFFLIRSTHRNFRRKRIAKGIGLGFASLILVILALIFLISPIGLLMG
jgi:hypothetical protein